MVSIFLSTYWMILYTSALTERFARLVVIRELFTAIKLRTACMTICSQYPRSISGQKSALVYSSLTACIREDIMSFRSPDKI